MPSATAFAAQLGLPIRDPELFGRALIHSSYQHEHRGQTGGHNERLEFLGDAVVSLVVSEALYLRWPEDDEGLLSARRASIVSTTGLARLADRLELGAWLLLGEGESQRGGRRRPSLLASAFEAVAGAVFLDLGFEAARDWILSVASPELADDSAIGALKSPKSRLQEHTQQVTGERPAYRLVDVVGPDHEREFQVEVSVGGRIVGVGRGLSRRLAETSAAVAALDSLAASQAGKAE
ncbi:MAG TPA: ribonuclease III [Candidatus Limnocylindrales bacterium]|jgi:ribonuclease-3